MSVREARLADMLLRLLGPAGLVRLAEWKGGTRLYVPGTDAASLARVIGAEAAARLADSHGGSYIRVPLAREIRARHYRASGRSNAWIATKLGMTESGVDRLFQSMPNKPAKGSGDPRQTDLFRP